jgi:Meckel syndrome type 1 protein
MAVLQLDATEPYMDAPARSDSSALFPAAPVYARTSKRGTSSKLALIVGLPVIAVAAGALIWGMTAQRAETPTTDAAPPAKIAQATPNALPETALPAPTPQPAPAPAAETAPKPTEVARAETAPSPRPAPRRAAAHRTAAASAPAAESAASNASATVPAPTTAPAPAPVIAAPSAAATPAPTPTPVTPVEPM